MRPSAAMPDLCLFSGDPSATLKFFATAVAIRQESARVSGRIRRHYAADVGARRNPQAGANLALSI